MKSNKIINNLLFFNFMILEEIQNRVYVNFLSITKGIKVKDIRENVKNSKKYHKKEFHLFLGDFYLSKGYDSLDIDVMQNLLSQEKILIEVRNKCELKGKVYF